MLAFICILVFIIKFSEYFELLPSGCNLSLVSNLICFLNGGCLNVVNSGARVVSSGARVVSSNCGDVNCYDIHFLVDHLSSGIVCSTGVVDLDTEVVSSACIWDNVGHGVTWGIIICGIRSGSGCDVECKISRDDVVVRDVVGHDIVSYNIISHDIVGREVVDCDVLCSGIGGGVDIVCASVLRFLGNFEEPVTRPA